MDFRDRLFLYSEEWFWLAWHNILWGTNVGGLYWSGLTARILFIWWRGVVDWENFPWKQDIHHSEGFGFNKISFHIWWFSLSLLRGCYGKSPDATTDCTLFVLRKNVPFIYPGMKSFIRTWWYWNSRKPRGTLGKLASPLRTKGGTPVKKPESFSGEKRVPRGKWRRIWRRKAHCHCRMQFKTCHSKKISPCVSEIIKN